MDIEGIGGRIMLLLGEKGWTEARLADEVGLSRNGVCYHVNGKRSPRAATLCLLADALECSVDYLLGRDDRRRP